MFGFKPKKPKIVLDKASGPDGARAYIIGDIHGCYAELVSLLKKIESDTRAKAPAEVYIVFLGDFIDRGPDSNKVVELLRRYRPDHINLVFLAGNHEEVFLKILAGNAEMIESWFGFGGRQCARSYGVQNLGNVFMHPHSVLDQLVKKVPQTHVQFLSKCLCQFRFGDFLCVHAGVRPNVPLDKQEESDLLWIRGKFLQHTKPYECVIVHGHSIVPDVEFLPNRIAIDTGAYRSGKLSALIIEGNSLDHLSS